MEAAALKWSKGGNGLQQLWFSTIVLEVRVAMHCNIPCHAESSSVVSRRGLGIMANVGTSAAWLAAGVGGRQQCRATTVTSARPLGGAARSKAKKDLSNGGQGVAQGYGPIRQ